MLESKLHKNIFYSLVEKILIIVAQVFVSFFVSKFISKEQLGVMAFIAGASTIIYSLNIVIENVLIRDLNTIPDEQHQVLLENLFSFNLNKSLVLGLLTCLVGCYYSFEKENIYFSYAAISLSLINLMDSIISPMIIYSTLKYYQDLVTKLAIVRWFINSFFIVGLVFFPSLKYLMIKDLALCCLVIYFWKIKFESHFKFRLFFKTGSLSFLKKYILGYSLYVHFISVISNIIYKIDGMILFYFVQLKTLGNYNIALTAANMASVLPSVLASQNNVALSSTSHVNDSFKTTAKFLRFSIYIGVLTFFSFLLLGKLYLNFISKNEVDEIYQYLIFIVSGLLIVKSLISPFVAFINVKGDVKKLLFRVQLPLLIFSIASYLLMGRNEGALGVAKANLINGIFWLFLILIEIKNYGFKISSIGSCLDDYNQLKYYAKKIFFKIRLISFGK